MENRNRTQADGNDRDTHHVGVTWPTSDPAALRLRTRANANNRNNRNGLSIGNAISATSYQ